ncbi:MAG TPA: metallophosphoesterase [Pseudolabrys sp.]|nr:metallophosphoesterase [Pseudolabrys sp.]
MFALAHLSDPHLAPLPQPGWRELIGKRITGYINWRRRRCFIHSPQALAALVADLKTQTTDHIAVTGDIANIAMADEFLRGRGWLDSLGPPHDVTFVPGNHDIYVKGAAELAGRQWGAFMSGDDGSVRFPFARRRGNIALIGLSSGVPTAPLLATGWLGSKQLAELAGALDALGHEKRFRVLLIHHPPVTSARRHKRLLDAAILLRVIASHGVELLLHGHDHRHMVNWLDGPGGSRIPAVGVPSASNVPGQAGDAAGYNIYRIEGERGAWQCDVISRGLTASGEMTQQRQFRLFG